MPDKSWFLEAPVAPTSLKFTKKTWKNKLKLTDQNMDQIQHCEMVAGQDIALKLPGKTIIRRQIMMLFFTETLQFEDRAMAHQVNNDLM